MRPLPLDGIRVLDLGRIYQGPWAGFLLAMAGADVVKVEEPWGEPTRRGRPDSTTVPFAILNSNKRNVSLNLKHPKGRELLLALAGKVDVLVENFAPGTMDELGLGPDVLLEANPRLIYGAATAFGTDGPDRDQLGMDLTVQAHTGVMSVTGFPGQPPVKAGVAFIDFLGGTHLYGAVVTALFERERTGRGRVVDVAMVDTIYPTMSSYLTGWYREGVAAPTGNRHGGGNLAPYNVYPALDGHVAIIVITDVHWRNLAEGMGRPELATDDRFETNRQRVRNIEDVDLAVTAWTTALPREEVVALCRAHKVPAASVRGLSELVDDPHLHQRGALLRVDHPDLGPVVLPHSPLRFRGSAPAPLVPSALVGADNEEIYSGWLGLPAEELDGLRAAGAI